MRDVEVSMFQFEQQLIQIQSQVQKNVNFDLDHMASVIADKIDKNPTMLIPSIMAQFH